MIGFPSKRFSGFAPIPGNKSFQNTIIVSTIVGESTFMEVPDMPIKRSLRLHLLAGLVLVVMTASVIIQYLVSRDTLRTKDNDVMRIFIEREIGNIDGWIREHGQMINLAGSLVQKAGETESEILHYLTTFLESGRDFVTLYFGTPDNRMINASKWRMPPGFDLRTRPWYLEALRAGDLTTTPVFLNASRDRLIITVCKPVYDAAGILKGVVAGDLPIDSLLGRIATTSPDTAGCSFVVGTEGRLLAHSSYLSNRNPLEVPFPDPDYSPVLARITHGKTGTFETTLAGVSGFLVFKHMEQLDLIVAAFVPDDKLDQTLGTLKITFFAIIAVSLVIWVSFVWYQRRHIDLPLALLEQGVTAIDPDARPWYRLPSIPSKDFTPIVHTINSILDRIELYYNEKNSAETALRKSLQEKESLLREVHHRVKNNMQIVVSLLESQADFQREPHSIEALQQIAQRVRSMAIVHEELYRSENLSQIPFTPVAEKIISSLADLLDHNHRIHWTIEDCDRGLDLVKAIPCGLILNELVSNVLKHAFAENEPGVLRVSLTALLDAPPKKQFLMTVEDNGRGLPEGLDMSATRSFGLQLVKILCKQLQADLTLDRSNGTRYSIFF